MMFSFFSKYNIKINDKDNKSMQTVFLRNWVQREKNEKTNRSN